jgi:UDP-N-acetylmuramoylalanine--D-glutamate ligase
VLATVLFTDIVGSTERARLLGDHAWKELLDRHYAVARDQLDRFRGRQVVATGDGLLAIFDGPARSIRCAQAIGAAIRSFKGVEHRLELVGEWDGVRWYNDSKATNPDAGRVALSAFPDSPLVLIAGGYGSGFELGPWVADLLRHADAVVLMGASAELLAKELADHPKVVRAESLEEAVELAAGLARPGGVVLLSPAYKSFDMFKDYEDRGRRFKALVRERFDR